MPEDFRIFQKFNDPELAETIANKLRSLDIEAQVSDDSVNFNPSYVSNMYESNIYVKIKHSDFDRAHQMLDEYYQEQINDVPPNYYLLSFSKRELMEIVAKPDEWGRFDYTLAKKLLAERGYAVTSDTVEALKEERLEELAKPEKAQPIWIIFGYICAISMFFVGIVIGYALAFSRKTLPNGQNVFIYTPETRRHGKRIFYIGLVFLATLLFMFITHR
ncbi:MAG TPA: hypothetical protein VI233_13365 [Puia sp.]